MNEINKAERVAINADKISKHYIIRERKRDFLKRVVLKTAKDVTNKVKAIDEISFEIKRGEAIGIIGKNGSGKSTVLQMICGTLTPTSGQLKVNGKVAALLELGSGFNPEFTGRENIMVNALLLGMSKKEIKIKTKNIIEFADIGIYIDQPVRTYSSGMIVRLAFAIIANADADILIIDEALAVGDSYFTQKCMRYIQRFKQKGTLVFVSHDPNAILSICDKAILLKGGRIIYEGRAKKALEIYSDELRNNQDEIMVNNLEDGDEQSHEVGKESFRNDYLNKWKDYRTELINQSSYRNNIKLMIPEEANMQLEDYGGVEAKILDTRLKNVGHENERLKLVGGELVSLTIEFIANKEINSFIGGFIMKNDMGLTLLGDNSYNKIESKQKNKAKRGEIISIEFIFTMPLLRAGKYSITTSVAEGSVENHKILHWQNDSILVESECTSIAAGIAGVPMQAINIKKVDSQ